MAKIKINLQRFFTNEARHAIIPAYKRLLTTGRGTKQDDAPTKKKKTGTNWLVSTGETRKKGFSFIAQPMRLLVFPSGLRHSGKRRYLTKRRGVQYGRSKNPPTYRQIFRWHKQGLSSYNGQRYSGVFGQLPVNSKTLERMDAEISIQVHDQIMNALTRRPLRRK